MNQPWFSAFGPAEASLSCGDAKHRLRWAEGTLQAVDHADAEGELVLAALGGDTSPCLDMVRAWGSHSDDLTVLAVGPRSPTENVTIPAAVLDELNALEDPAALGHRGPGNPTAYRIRSGRASFGVVGGMSTVTYRGSPGSAPRPMSLHRLRQAALMRARLRSRSSGWTGSRPLRPRGFPGRGGFARLAHLGWPGADVDQARLELIRLLALGAPFQFRLSAAVAHAWSAPSDRADRWQGARPALAAALAGRLVPAAQQWLGIDPGKVDVTIHDSASWGEITRTQSDGNARLVARLPIGWLAEIWAPGLSVVGSHLVVALVQADWPQATVLALRAPGQEPVQLEVRHEQGHWSETSR